MVGGIENEGESMPKTRKSHPPSLKAKVAVEAIKAHKTAAQIAQMFGVHPTQVGGWKKQALAGLPDIFGNGREQNAPAVRHRKRRALLPLPKRLREPSHSPPSVEGRESSAPQSKWSNFGNTACGDLSLSKSHCDP